MGMTSYPIIYLDLAAYITDNDDRPNVFFKLAKIEYAVIDDSYFLVVE